MKLKNLLQDEFNLNPIVIFKKPGISRVILEKFENEASTCSFAFALFTKDDFVQKDEGDYYQPDQM